MSIRFLFQGQPEEFTLNGVVLDGSAAENEEEREVAGLGHGSGEPREITLQKNDAMAPNPLRPDS